MLSAVCFQICFAYVSQYFSSSSSHIIMHQMIVHVLLEEYSNSLNCETMLKVAAVIYRRLLSASDKINSEIFFEHIMNLSTTFSKLVPSNCLMLGTSEEDTEDVIITDEAGSALSEQEDLSGRTF